MMPAPEQQMEPTFLEPATLRLPWSDVRLLDNEARTLGNQQSLTLLLLMAVTLLIAIGVAVTVVRNLSRPIMSLTARRRSHQPWNVGHSSGRHLEG
jgi:hypothetical protein